MHVAEEALSNRHILSLDYVHRNLASSNGLEIDYFSLFNYWLETAAFDEEFVDQPNKRILSLEHLHLSYH